MESWNKIKVTQVIDLIWDLRVYFNTLFLSLSLSLALSLLLSLSLSLSLTVYIYIYIHMCVCVCVRWEMLFIEMKFKLCTDLFIQLEPNLRQVTYRHHNRYR